MNKHKKLIAFVLGVLVGASVTYINQPETQTRTSDNTEVHEHSDFLMVINGTAINLTADEYQSVAGNVLHKDSHLHDNNDDVLHRHAGGITIAKFLNSLGYTLTDTCLGTDAGEEYCTGQSNSLQLFVNEIAVESITTYIPQEEDKILLFYGNNDPSEYFGKITEDSCIYSLTCPEKGTPPPESCGLTCEL